MTEKKTYTFSPDLIRALGIIFVVVIHVFTPLVNTPSQFLTINWWLENTIVSLARPAVPLFIMLSGLLLLNPQKNYSPIQFYKKRFSKIGIPIVVWPLLYYLWKYHMNDQQFTWGKFFHDFIYLNTYYHMYFLLLIAGLYAITPLIKPLWTRLSTLYKLLIITALLCMGGTITYLRFFEQFRDPFNTIYTIFIPYLGFYFLGDRLREVLLSKKQMIYGTILFLLLVIATAYGNMLHMQYLQWSTTMQGTRFPYGRYFYEYLSITVIPQSIVLFLLLQNLPRHIPAIQHDRLGGTIRNLSKYSFGIYLIHIFVLSLVNTIVRGNYVALLPDILVLVLRTFFVLGISFIIVKYLSKIPVIKEIFG